MQNTRLSCLSSLLLVSYLLGESGGRSFTRSNHLLSGPSNGERLASPVSVLEKSCLTSSGNLEEVGGWAMPKIRLPVVDEVGNPLFVGPFCLSEPTPTDDPSYYLSPESKRNVVCNNIAYPFDKTLMGTREPCGTASRCTEDLFDCSEWKGYMESVRDNKLMRGSLVSNIEMMEPVYLREGSGFGNYAIVHIVDKRIGYILVDKEPLGTYAEEIVSNVFRLPVSVRSNETEKGTVVVQIWPMLERQFLNIGMDNVDEITTLGEIRVGMKVWSKWTHEKVGTMVTDLGVEVNKYIDGKFVTMLLEWSRNPPSGSYILDGYERLCKGVIVLLSVDKHPIGTGYIGHNLSEICVCTPEIGGLAEYPILVNDCPFYNTSEVFGHYNLISKQKMETILRGTKIKSVVVRGYKTMKDAQSELATYRTGFWVMLGGLLALMSYVLIGSPVFFMHFFKGNEGEKLQMYMGKSEKFDIYWVLLKFGLSRPPSQLERVSKTNKTNVKRYTWCKTAGILCLVWFSYVPKSAHAIEIEVNTLDLKEGCELAEAEGVTLNICVENLLIKMESDYSYTIPRVSSIVDGVRCDTENCWQRCSGDDDNICLQGCSLSNGNKGKGRSWVKNWYIGEDPHFGGHARCQTGLTDVGDDVSRTVPRGHSSCGRYNWWSWGHQCWGIAGEDVEAGAYGTTQVYCYRDVMALFENTRRLTTEFDISICDASSAEGDCMSAFASLTSGAVVSLTGTLGTGSLTVYDLIEYKQDKGTHIGSYMNCDKMRDPSDADVLTGSLKFVYSAVKGLPIAGGPGDFQVVRWDKTLSSKTPHYRRELSTQHIAMAGGGDANCRNGCKCTPEGNSVQNKPARKTMRSKVKKTSRGVPKLNMRRALNDMGWKKDAAESRDIIEWIRGEVYMQCATWELPSLGSARLNDENVMDELEFASNVKVLKSTVNVIRGEENYLGTLSSDAKFSDGKYGLMSFSIKVEVENPGGTPALCETVVGAEAAGFDTNCVARDDFSSNTICLVSLSCSSPGMFFYTLQKHRPSVVNVVAGDNPIELRAKPIAILGNETLQLFAGFGTGLVHGLKREIKGTSIGALSLTTIWTGQITNPEPPSGGVGGTGSGFVDFLLDVLLWPLSVLGNNLGGWLVTIIYWILLVLIIILLLFVVYKIIVRCLSKSKENDTNLVVMTDTEGIRQITHK